MNWPDVLARDASGDGGPPPLARGWRRWLPDLVAVGLMLALVGRRWWQMGAFPTGLDGGQWLALGRGLLGGPGRGTDGAYAPLVPLLAAAGQAVVGPTLALKLIAIGSFAAIGALVWLIARDGLGRGWGLFVVALVAPASTLTEPLAFGGYPQQVALAGLLLGGWALGRFLTRGDRGWLVACGGGLATAALSHHVYFPLALAVAGVVGGIWLISRPDRGTLLSRLRGAMVVVGVSIVLFLPTGWAFLTADYAPPLAAAGLDRAAAWQYGTREAVVVWTGLALAGVVGLALTAAIARRQATWQLAMALTGVAGGLFLLSAEPRLLPPLLIGLALGTGYGLRWLAGRLAVVGGSRALVPVGIALALPLILLRPADGEAMAFFRFYRVLDQSLLDTASAISAEPPDGLVAVRADSRGWPVGWWLEGLTTAPLAIGSDPRWLGFPAERERAALVESLFAPGLSGAEVRALAGEHGIALLVIPKWKWIGWQRWTTGINAPVTIIYDDNVHLILSLQPVAKLPDASASDNERETTAGRGPGERIAHSAIKSGGVAEWRTQRRSSQRRFRPKRGGRSNCGVWLAARMAMSLAPPILARLRTHARDGAQRRHRAAR